MTRKKAPTKKKTAKKAPTRPSKRERDLEKREKELEAELEKERERAALDDEILDELLDLNSSVLSYGESKESEILRQVDFAEKLFVRRLGPGLIRRLLEDKFGISSSTASNRIADVRARWADEAKFEGTREAKREHNRKTAEALFAAAIRKKDLKVALGAHRLVCQIDGSLDHKEGGGKTIGDMASKAAAALLRKRARDELAKKTAEDAGVDLGVDDDAESESDTLEKRILAAASRIAVLDGG